MNEAKQFLASRKKANLIMVAVNLIVFLIMSLIGDTESSRFMLAHGACYTPLVLRGEYYRVFTSMFLHFGIHHVVNNMICLLFIGDFLETITGAVRYLIIYLAGGVCGNLLSMAWEIRTGEFSVSAGASGAVFALVGAMLYIILRNRKSFRREFRQRFIVIVVLSVFEGFTSVGTDNAAHVGGLLAGFLLAVLLYHPHGNRRIGGDRGTPWNGGMRV